MQRKIVDYWRQTKIKNINGEKWLPAPGYKGVYCSTLGRVRSVGRWVKTGRGGKGKRYVPEIIHSQCKGKDGYLRLSIRVNGKEKKMTAHRLCALTFCPNPLKKKTVQHKNNIKHCNQKWNLCWFTQGEQVQDAYDRGRVPPLLGRTGSRCVASKKIKCLNNGKVYASITIAAQQLNVSDTYIKMVCNGYKAKTNKGKNLRFKLL